jgi:hypothetical protein
MGMKGYKGFNEKFQCTPEGKVFQYEVGRNTSMKVMLFGA